MTSRWKAVPLPGSHEDVAGKTGKIHINYGGDLVGMDARPCLGFDKRAIVTQGVDNVGYVAGVGHVRTVYSLRLLQNLKLKKNVLLLCAKR